MKKRHVSATLAALVLVGCSFSTAQAYDEYLNNYKIDDVVVSADRINNKFGDTITEQSYYRTGGDVKVITRDEIEKRHYENITDAIKRVPGVTFQNPGYRGGEYGYQFYNNGIAINGDTRVVILVDGRRIDNVASTRFGYSSNKGTKATGVNLDQATNISNVEKIEVIKGPGASVYGPDATGGAINIITRQGGDKPQGEVSVSLGNWNKKRVEVAYSGPISKDKNTKLFIGASKMSSGDTAYIDGITKDKGTLIGSNYDEKSFNIRADHRIDDQRNLTISMNINTGRDGYPLSTPNLQYWNKKDWDRIIFNAAVGKLDKDNKAILTPVYKKDKDGNIEKDSNGNPVIEKYNPKWFAQTGNTKNPGYATLFTLDGHYGSFSEYNNHDYEIKYTFKKVKDMPSFVRAYYQYHDFRKNDTFEWVNDPSRSFADFKKEIPRNGDRRKWAWKKFTELYPNGATAAQIQEFTKMYLAPFPGDKKAINEWIAKTGGKVGAPDEWNTEKNKGIEVQYANSYGKHDVIASITYDQAENGAYNVKSTTPYELYKRNSLIAYVQDKIHVNPNLDVTPALRLSHYGPFKIGDGKKLEDTKNNSKVTALTGAVNLQYKFDDATSGYFGLTQVYRPLRPFDYNKDATKTINGSLKDERGVALTAGIQKNLDDTTLLGVHVDYTHMSNAIASLPYGIDTETGEFLTGVGNARENKYAFNITLDKYINDNWTISGAYTYLHDKWSLKDGYAIPKGANYENLSDINTGINQLRPKHHFSLNVSYEKDKLYTGLLANFYLGNNKEAFTAKNFVVLDWSLNYQFNKDMTGFVLINNLTDTAYQTVYSPYNGIDTASMPARSYMVGLKYTF